MSRLFPLLLLAFAHALVDGFAILVEPLWPKLQLAYDLSSQKLFWVLTITAVSPSLAQIIFGYLRDRHGARYTLWVGPLLTALSIPFLGFSSSFLLLGLCLFVGYSAIGAFHPEAAVVASGIVPNHRARCLSIFMFGGTLGLGLGPIVSGNLVARYGLGSLVWLGVPGVVFVALYWFFVCRSPLPVAREAAVAAKMSLSEMLQGRGSWMCYLLFVGGLRTVPGIGMGKALAYTLDGRGYDSSVIGNTQSLFLLSGSAGMLLMAAGFRQGWERRLLFWSPLAAILPLMGMGIVGLNYWVLLALLVPAGIIINGTAPAMVSYSHQLLPRGAGMASAVTMGLSWGIGGMIVSGMTSVFTEMGRPELLFHAFIPCSALSALGAYFLPEVAEDVE